MSPLALIYIAISYAKFSRLFPTHISFSQLFLIGNFLIKFPIFSRFFKTVYEPWMVCECACVYCVNINFDKITKTGKIQIRAIQVTFSD